MSDPSPSTHSLLANTAMKRPRQWTLSAMPDTPRFLPHTTVATVIERSGQFLLVEEVSQGIAVLNQPAGHLEQHESLIDAAARETLEETCWHSDITAYLGVTIVTAQNGICYLRHSFVATALEFDNTLTRDSSIIDTSCCWRFNIRRFYYCFRSPSWGIFQSKLHV